jgi:hypothetical protein
MTERKRPQDVEEDFDLWKLGRGAAEETHQAEFCAK